ncbi:hypothetical protein [Mangrovimonas sp. YM274]|uniref:hypothetical protein n=1 Tax=Mangrovimonas sp. YM274 TaxID=3070660 RepID=UPI0027DCBA65|nr:hypothetical protein [Mangrovimonas sp. YM274]WMI69042.1 hypothetical protein RBH95_01415 [Mangrovimonas sp. YM274]
MILKKSLLALTLAATLFSCSSDSSDSDSQIPQETGHLKQITWTFTDGEIYSETLSYDGDKLISIEDSDGWKFKYIYENDMLIRINELNDSGIVTTYTLLEYDVENRLSSYTAYISSISEEWGWDLTYNEDGTVSESSYEKSFNGSMLGEQESTIVLDNGQITGYYADGYNFNYEYDSNNGIYKNISHIEILNLMDRSFQGYFESGLNNLTKITANYGGEGYDREVYEYSYNSNNYPATANYYWEGELDATIEYIYE